MSETDGVPERRRAPRPPYPAEFKERAVRMVFDAQGRKRTHRFVRGLMRSAAKLTYEEAQGAIDGRLDDRAGLRPRAAHPPTFRPGAARTPRCGQS